MNLRSNLPSTLYCSVFRHDHTIQQRNGLDSSHCGHLILAGTRQLPSEVSICPPLHQSSWLSSPETTLSCYLPSTHLQSTRSHQGLPMYEGEYKHFEEKRVTYKNFAFQRLQPIHKLIVDIDLDVVSTWQVLSRCLGPHGHKTIAKNGFLGNSKSLVNQFQCHRPVDVVPPLHTPDHRMQRTGQLHGSLHHMCIVSHLMVSPMPRQVSAGPLLSPSCPFSFARIGPDEVRGDFQVCFHLDIVLCRFRNVDECVFDRSNSHLGKMPPSRPPLTVCWPW